MDDRIELLVERIKSRRAYMTNDFFQGFDALKGESYRDTFPSDSFYHKNISAFASLLQKIDKKIFPEELIVGWMPDVEEKRDKERNALYKEKYSIYAAEIKKGGITGHFAPNYRKVLEKGLKSAYSDICSKLKELDPALPENIEKIEFLKAAKLALEAFKAYCEAYSSQAGKMSEEGVSPERKKELLEISRICSKVPWEPAGSFHEALQSVFFLYMGLLMDIPAPASFGRLDRYLEPYLEKDIKNGKITWDYALYLMRNFCAKTNEWILSPHSIMLGGRTDEGKPYFSSATRLILEAIDKNRLINPAPGISICKDTDDYLWKKSVEMIASGFGHPALFSDETITGGLIGIGVSPEDACEFVHSTCTEITIPGKGYIWVTSAYINFPRAFEYIWYRGKDRQGNIAGVDTGDLEGFDSWDKLVDAVKTQLAHQVYLNTVAQNRFIWRRMIFDPKPFSSCIVDSCIERQIDITRGGAVYNFVYPQLVGLANVVDGLMAIKKLVYEKGRYSLGQIKEAVEKNFSGYEILRQEILHKMPHYGTDNEETDGLAVELADFFCDEVIKYRTPLSRYYPGFLVWMYHLRFGKECMATPDGRLDGTPVADSLAAMQGRASKGLTAILNTASKLHLSRAVGAAVVNLHIPSSLLEKEKDRDKFAHLLKTHLLDGGFQVQVTMVDAAELRKAQKNPEKYRDLMVRVGGYCEYFTRLAPELQNTIIERAE